MNIKKKKQTIFCKLFAFWFWKCSFLKVIICTCGAVDCVCFDSISAMFIRFSLWDLTENLLCSVVLPCWVFSLLEPPISPRPYILGLSYWKRETLWEVKRCFLLLLLSTIRFLILGVEDAWYCTRLCSKDVCTSIKYKSIIFFVCFVNLWHSLSSIFHL